MTEVSITIETGQHPVNGKTLKIVKIAGQLDESNVDQEIQKIYQTMEETPSNLDLIFDLENLEYMNSKSIGYMTDLYGKLSESGGKMFITKARPNITDILQVVGLTQLVTLYDTTEEAKLALSTAPVTPAAPVAPAIPLAPATPTPVATPITPIAPATTVETPVTTIETVIPETPTETIVNTPISEPVVETPATPIEPEVATTPVNLQGSPEQIAPEIPSIPVAPKVEVSMQAPTQPVAPTAPAAPAETITAVAPAPQAAQAPATPTVEGMPEAPVNKDSDASYTFE